jgi:hypothetical protein
MKKRDKIRRIAMAAALATTVLVGTPQISFAQTASETLAALSAQVRAMDFAGSRATIRQLQENGFIGIRVGNEILSFEDLLGMIDAASSGEMHPTSLAGYLGSLATNTALALFVPGVPEENESIQSEGDDRFPAGSTG